MKGPVKDSALTLFLNTMFSDAQPSLYKEKNFSSLEIDLINTSLFTLNSCLWSKSIFFSDRKHYSFNSQNITIGRFLISNALSNDKPFSSHKESCRANGFDSFLKSSLYHTASSPLPQRHLQLKRNCYIISHVDTADCSGKISSCS